jgi:glycosyltransferase involved in cell wall biosynthesis
MSGRVLLVTYFFPPVGGVGVQRTLKYVTYLPKWGWQPVVVAPRDPGYPIRDESLVAALAPDLEIHRSLSLEPSRARRAIAARLLGRGKAGKPSAAPDQVASRRGSATVGRSPLRLGASLWSRVWGAVLFPDEAVAWVPFGARSGRRIARTGSIDVVYSSSPPISAHLVAWMIKRATGKPWVADFRDPWVGNSFALPSSGIRQRLSRRTERLIVERADRVVLAVDELREMFVKRYPRFADKFVYIPNGYDLSELAGLEPARHRPDTFVLLYAGSLYRPRELEAFLLGVERLVARRPDLRRRLRVEFVGRANEENRRLAETYSAPDRIGDVVSFEGFVPRREALARMAGADALLQLMPAEPGASMFVGGKLMEYLAFGRPILAVMPPGEGRRLVDSVPVGRSADAEPESIAAALERLIDDPPSGGSADPTGRYDRVNLAGELAALLDDVVAERAGQVGG